MAVITTNSAPKLLWPGLSKVWGLEYKLWDDGAQWKQIFSQHTSTKAYEEDVTLTGFSNALVKPEGESIVYQDDRQGYVSRYVNRTFALGFIVTMEEQEDNQYAQVAVDRARCLVRGLTRAREIDGARILNQAFNPNVKYGDGQPLISTAHPLFRTTGIGQGSNTFNGVSASLSAYALEQATTDINGFVDQRGNAIQAKPLKLIVPRQLQFDATRILKNTQWMPGTANRDINALVVNNSIPQGMAVNHYLIDPSAWFIVTDVPNGLKYFSRIEPSFTPDKDNDFDTTNHKFRVRGRWSFGVTDWRGIFGVTT
jgi:hypothetical protein